MDWLVYELTDFTLLSTLLRLLLATMVGGLIGMERGRHGRAAGLRTHGLVCLGAALAALVGLYAAEALGYASDPLRVGAQVISGIGFLGVGTILVKGRFQVTGLTTAAGLWATAAIGLACGMGFYVGAVLAALLTLVTITWLSRLEAHINRRHRRFGVYIELEDVRYVQDTAAHLGERYGTDDVQVTPPRSALPHYVGIEVTVHTRGGAHPTVGEVIADLRGRPGVAFVLESV